MLNRVSHNIFGLTIFINKCRHKTQRFAAWPQPYKGIKGKGDIRKLYSGQSSKQQTAERNYSKTKKPSRTRQRQKLPIIFSEREIKDPLNG